MPLRVQVKHSIQIRLYELFLPTSMHVQAKLSSSSTAFVLVETTYLTEIEYYVFRHS